ncbi:MAG: tRNA-specific adenosine deaminase [Candidatus Angelobacter sp.]|nr:tRNA-specific adenosine deaminase [Candidatus Angelobacter sp.]
MSTNSSNPFMAEAIALSLKNVREGNGGPFAAVIVKDGRIIARGLNRVTSTNDPTAHAEVVAIREACAALKSFQLTGCEIYSSCEPCPMCLAAIYWARPSKVFFGNSKEDAAAAGFDDSFIYKEIALAGERRKIPLVQLMRDEAIRAFQEWAKSPMKVEY